MHLGLIDQPFVPHNVIATQESPVLLPKFQMATRLKTLMSSGSKKGTHIHHSFSQKAPGSESPPGSPIGLLWREIPAYRAFFTSLLIYRVSQEERTRLRESVPYVKLYRYNPKHLYPKLNGYGDNGQRSLKL